MPAVRLTKMALVVSSVWYSPMTGSNCFEKRLALLQPARRQIGRRAADA